MMPLLHISKLGMLLLPAAGWLFIVMAHFTKKFDAYAAMFQAPPEPELFGPIKKHTEMMDCDLCPKPPQPRFTTYTPVNVPGWATYKTYKTYRPSLLIADGAAATAFNSFPRRKTYGQLKEEMRMEAEDQEVPRTDLGSCNHKTSDGMSAFEQTPSGDICKRCMMRREIPLKCLHCHAQLEPMKADTDYCSPSCRLLATGRVNTTQDEIDRIYNIPKGS